MRKTYKIFAAFLCFVLLCGCAQKAEKVKKLPEYSASFDFKEKYAEVGIDYNNKSVYTTNLYGDRASDIYDKLCSADFVPISKPKSQKKEKLTLYFENTSAENGKRESLSFTVLKDNTVIFNENKKSFYFTAKSGTYKSLMTAAEELLVEAEKYCKTENSVYTLTGANGQAVQLQAKTESRFITLYKPNVIRINDGGEVYYFDCENGVLSPAVSPISDYSLGHIANAFGREIKLLSIYEGGFDYTVNTFEKALAEGDSPIFTVRFVDDNTLDVSYESQEGVHTQRVDLSSYYKDYEDKKAAARKSASVTAEKKNTQKNKNTIPANYSYDPPTQGTVNGIPPFTAEMDARLMQYTNVRSGYGWKGAENRQGYYSQFNAYATGDRSKNTVYLTFDEGYEYNENTNKILDILAEKNVKAVFFVTMDFAKKRPDLIRRMINEGHTVGNHSTTHPSFPAITTRQGYDEIKTLHDYIYNNFGYRMSLFRFPEGAASDRTLALVKEMGYATVFWNCAYADWDTSKQPSAEQTRSVVANNTQNGTIYLFHAVSNTNVAILGEIIDTVRGWGYQFGLFG